MFQYRYATAVDYVLLFFAITLGLVQAALLCSQIIILRFFSDVLVEGQISVCFEFLSPGMSSFYFSGTTVASTTRRTERERFDA